MANNQSDPSDNQTSQVIPNSEDNPAPPAWIQDDPTNTNQNSQPNPIEPEGQASSPVWNQPQPDFTTPADSSNNFSQATDSQHNPYDQFEPQSEPAYAQPSDPYNGATDEQGLNPPSFYQNEPSSPPPFSQETSVAAGSTPPPPTFTQDNEPLPKNDADLTGASLSSNKGGFLKKLILFVFILAILAGIGFVVTQVILPQLSSSGSVSLFPGGQKEKIILTYWGLWEPNSILDEVIQSYEQDNKNVDIQYIQQNKKDYRERLQSAIAQGTGPDIFRLHLSWIPMFKNDLNSDTNKVIDLSKYYSPISRDISINGQAMAVPLEFDCLSLYYNPAMLQKASVSVPTTWDELRKTAKILTINDVNGRIQRGGIAMGTTSNVDHFSDIIGLLLLQNEANLAIPNNKLAEDALLYYTLFSTVDKVWNETLPTSVYAFATEKTAMVFAPSWQAFEINAINPDLIFETAAVPQVPDGQVAWSTYWVEGVSNKNKNSDESWKFLAYLSREDNLTKMYTAAAKIRAFGEPYPITSLGNTIENEPVVGTFIKQAPYAKNWYLSSATYDNGINDRIIKYYQDATNRIVQGASPSEVTPTLTQGINQVLSQYGLVTVTSN